MNCQREFTTRESIDLSNVLKVKEEREGKAKVSSYSKATLLLSLLKVCDHRTEKDDVYWLCDTVEQVLVEHAAQQNGVLTKDDLIKSVLEVLKRFDTPAFVKYLSYHSTALDARTLKRQLKG